jgi:Uma2 family endonuclease
VATKNAVVIDGEIAIPADAFTFEGFERWCFSKNFPETGRIDYLAGTIELELNEVGEGTEDLFTHNAVLMAIGARLHSLLSEEDLGEVFSKGARIVLPKARLSVTPDLTVILQESLDQERAQLLPGRSADCFRGIEGTPDLIVEVLSDTSEKKDAKLLPRLYAQAGVPELWLVDARGKDLRFDLFTLRDGRYETVPPNTVGWTFCPGLSRAFRLVRQHRPRLGTWRYTLEHRKA